MKKFLEEGLHYFSGIDEIFIPGDEWTDDTDGVVLIIDGQQYIAYKDPDDGYRSYGMFSPLYKECEVLTTFPPQLVLIEYHDWDYIDDECYIHFSGSVLTIRNSENNEEILRVGTDTSDGYYPMAIFDYHPENLSINKNR